MVHNKYHVWAVQNKHDLRGVVFEAVPGTRTPVPVLETWPDGVPMPDESDLPALEDCDAIIEQARLQAVYTDHAASIQEFAEAWAKTGIESVPDDWQEAITLLKAKYASLVTIEEKLEHMSVQQELITLRFGPLAAVWDDVTVILNSQ